MNVDPFVARYMRIVEKLDQQERATLFDLACGRRVDDHTLLERLRNKGLVQRGRAHEYSFSDPQMRSWLAAKAAR